MHHHKYGDRTSEDVRRTLLSLTLDFLREARTLAGVTRIAMLGSLLGSKPYPKDADLLVTITGEVDFNRLAALGTHRRVEASIPIPPDLLEQLIGPLERELARDR